MSKVLAEYPDLYPPHVVGAVKAGEQGGFVPDACDMVAQQAENAHKFKRLFMYVWVILVNIFLSIPLMLIARTAFLDAYDRTEQRGNSSFNTVVSDFFSYVWKYIVWPVGPITLVTYVACFLLWRLLLASGSRRFRHKLGLNWPVFGVRAKHECLTMFSWTMSRLTAAGIPYNQSWQMAADAVPNIAMTERLQQVGQRLATNERVSDAVGSSRLFPQEYAPTIATAEYSGNLPGALDQLSRSSRAEFEAQQNYAKLRGGCWGCLALIVTSAAILFVFMYMWYYELPARVLKGLEP